MEAQEGLERVKLRVGRRVRVEERDPVRKTRMDVSRGSLKLFNPRTMTHAGSGKAMSGTEITSVNSDMKNIICWPRMSQKTNTVSEAQTVRVSPKRWTHR